LLQHVPELKKIKKKNYTWLAKHERLLKSFNCFLLSSDISRSYHFTALKSRHKESSW